MRSSGGGPQGAAVLAAVLALGVAMVSVQAGAALSKQLFGLIGPAGAACLRTSLAAVVLALVVRPFRQPIPRAALAPVIAYGAVLGLMNLIFYASLARIPLGLAVGLEFIGPLGVAIFGSRRLIDAGFGLLAAIGVALLLPLPGDVRHADPLGVGLALVAGALWALYILLGARAGAALGGRAVAVGALFAALAVLPFGVAHAGARLLEPKALGLGLSLAVLSSVVPYSLEMAALTRLPSRVFGVMMSAEPAIAAMIGLAFLGERLDARQWIALAAVMAASIGAAAGSSGAAPTDPA